MVVLYTERLCIRDHTMDDLAGHHGLISDPRVMRYLLDIKADTLEDSKRDLESAVAEAGSPDRRLYFFRIEGKSGGEHIGEIGYTVTAETPAGKTAGAGYFILERHWGQGYTTEAFREVMRYAFEEGGVYRLTCGCLSENRASENVMVKCGMIKEAEFKDHTWHEGRPKDRVEYRLLRPEWEQYTRGTDCSVQKRG
ncbi:GNAT family N-acetyltransferase [Breznakiella homolactica]|uniref:GNAT family N-acetyltransferase n=1 Tax=Breznakiella homolactica TaxID=2798577 RepID=A0A7T8BB28_9SPIR|nr:GNAT family protein [Breznakiella homolactica]QQO09605.1 GNAT family N-acetyltransferase [Breznakiella homolactica]